MHIPLCVFLMETSTEQGCQDERSIGSPAHGLGDRTGSLQGLQVMALAGVDQAPGAVCKARLGQGGWRPTGHRGWGRGHRGVCGTVVEREVMVLQRTARTFPSISFLLVFFPPLLSSLRKSCNETD